MIAIKITLFVKNKINHEKIINAPYTLCKFVIFVVLIKLQSNTALYEYVQQLGFK